MMVLIILELERFRNKGDLDDCRLDKLDQAG